MLHRTRCEVPSRRRGRYRTGTEKVKVPPNRQGRNLNDTVDADEVQWTAMISLVDAVYGDGTHPCSSTSTPHTLGMDAMTPMLWLLQQSQPSCWLCPSQHPIVRPLKHLDTILSQNLIPSIHRLPDPPNSLQVLLQGITDCIAEPSILSL